MNKLAQATIPGLQNIYDFGKQKTPQIQTLGGLLSKLLEIAFFAAIFIAFYFLAWGAFAYIMAQGNKENLAKARARITYAIIGLFVVLLAYFIAQFAGEILQPKGGLPF